MGFNSPTKNKRIRVRAIIEKISKNNNRYWRVSTDSGYFTAFDETELGKLEQNVVYEISYAPSEQDENTGIIREVLSRYDDADVPPEPTPAPSAESSKPAPIAKPQLSRAAKPSATSWEIHRDNKITRMSVVNAAASVIAAKIRASAAYAAKDVEDYSGDITELAARLLVFANDVTEIDTNITSEPPFVEQTPQFRTGAPAAVPQETMPDAHMTSPVPESEAPTEVVDPPAEKRTYISGGPSEQTPLPSATGVEMPAPTLAKEPPKIFAGSSGLQHASGSQSVAERLKMLKKQAAEKK